MEKPYSAHAIIKSRIIPPIFDDPMVLATPAQVDIMATTLYVYCPE